MIRHLIFILFVISFNRSIFSQTKAQIDKLNTQFFELYDSDIDLAFENVKKALQYSKKIGYTKGKGAALYRIGVVHDIKLRPDSAKIYILDGISILKTTKEYAELGDAYNNLGAHYYYQFDYNNAISAHEKAIDFYSKSNEPGGASRALNNIGICYKNLNQKDKALSTYKKSLDLGVKLKDSMTISIAYASISGLYIEDKKFNEALEYNLLSEKNAPFGDNYTRITILFSRGEIFMNLGDLKNSESALKEGMKLASTSGNYERLQYFYKSMSELKRRQNKFNEAFFFINKYDSLRDKMYDKDRNEFMAFYEKKFDLTQKQLENTNEKLKRKDSQVKLAKSKRNLWIAVLVIFILLCLFLFMFYALNERRKKIELDKKHIEEVNLLSKELHHRIKNNLQFVSSLLSIETRGLDAETIERIDRVIDAMQVMSTIHQTLYSFSEWDKINLKNLFDLLSNQGEKLKKDLVCEFSTPDLEIDINTGVSIGLLLNELMTNSVKHAFSFNENPVIKAAIVQDANGFTLFYSDNGSGQDSETNGSVTFGSRFLNILCKKLGGELLIQDSPIGYSVKLHITKIETR